MLWFRRAGAREVFEGFVFGVQNAFLETGLGPSLPYLIQVEMAL